MSAPDVTWTVTDGSANHTVTLTSNKAERTRLLTDLVDEIRRQGIGDTLRVLAYSENPVIRAMFIDQLVDAMPDRVWTTDLAPAVAESLATALDDVSMAPPTCSFGRCQHLAQAEIGFCHEHEAQVADAWMQAVTA